MSFPLIITDVGRAALVNAANLGLLPVTIAQVGVSATAFTPTNATTALPGELKRLATIGGVNVAPATIHMTVLDNSTDVYNLYSFGLYLSDGTLFAAYSSATLVLSKVAASSLLLAADIEFASITATSLTFGSTNFTDPPASETVKGVAYIAQDADMTAGTDDTKIVSPLRLWRLLTGAIGTGFAAMSRKINVGGLVSGGGDLTADRTLTVTASTNAQAAAGVDTTTAMTPASTASLFAARTVLGAGLVTGGGSLSGNQTLTVTASTNAQGVTGTNTTTAMTPASTTAAIAAQAPGLAPVQSFNTRTGAVVLTLADVLAALAELDSGQKTISGTQVTWAHGLGAEPRFVTAQLECVTASDGYQAGDVYALPATTYTGNAGPPDSHGGVGWNATNAWYAFTSASNINIPAAGGGSGTTITPANWAIRFRARR